MPAKEKIYTIPVNDAFQSPHPCPLCDLYADLEASLIEYYLGPALMESDVRQSTNQHGFCSEHWAMLYNSQLNRLGLGLTIHTHLNELRANLGQSLQKAKFEEAGFMQRLFKKNDQPEEQNVAAQIKQRADDCVICRRLDQTMERYLDVIYYQYFEVPGFKDEFHDNKLYCLKHLAFMLENVPNYLRGERAKTFTEELIKDQLERWETLASDVEWFTKKFDYRYKNEPWKNSKDSIPRAINFLGSSPQLEGTGFGKVRDAEEMEANDER